MKRILPILLCLLLLLSVSLPAFAEDAEEEGPEPIYLNNEQDFLAFTENCAVESYSSEQVFILTADLDLSGLDYHPAPYFAGVFQGGNNKISGLDLRAAGSRLGLFRTVAEGAEVRDLRVFGSLAPDGSQCDIGGIAGVNGGLITGCSFIGSVQGIENVGGIAGLNEESGCIAHCSVSGTVLGEHQVGGVAGLNLGVAEDCLSFSQVNTVAITPVGEASFDISSISTDDFVNLSNIGGIAGENAGVIHSCRNAGPVGYKATGYNVGGIAGKSSGFISACVNEGSVDGRRDVGGILGQLVPYAAWDFTNGQLEALGNEIEGMRYLVSVAVQDTNAQTSALRGILSQMNGFTADAMSALTGIFASVVDQERALIENISFNQETGEVKLPELNLSPVDTSGLTAALNNMYAQTSMLTSQLTGSVSEMADNLNAISYQMSRIFDTLFSMVSEASNASLINTYDLSADEAYDHDDGAVARCSNSGAVKAETNAGGIVGTVAFEVAFDMEDRLDASSFLSGSAQQYLFAAIRACRSGGEVQSKSDNAGAIAGRMDIGAVVDCIGTGKIQSLSGSYVGGIAGNAKGTISNCWARPDLSGSRYVGGIVGLGNTVRGCRVWPHFRSFGEYAGAVAGWADGSIEENRYVSGRPAGVDDVSRIGQSEPVSKLQFVAFEDLPDGFKTVTVQFQVDGKTVSRKELVFGRGLDRLPEVPNKEGKYWVWDDFDREHIYSDLIVGGAYFSPAATLSSGEAQPLFLVEGQFYEGQSLQVDRISGQEQAYSLQVNDYSGDLIVHMRAEQGGSVDRLHDDGTREAISASSDGTYLVFTIPNGASFVWIPAEQHFRSPWVPVGCGAGLVAVAVGIAVAAKRKKAKSTPVS